MYVYMSRLVYSMDTAQSAKKQIEFPYVVVPDSFLKLPGQLKNKIIMFFLLNMSIKTTSNKGNSMLKKKMHIK